VNIYVNSEIGSDRNVSLAVTGTVRLYAERPMYFRYKDRWTGGHCSQPALDSSTTWYFAEGTTRSGFEEWLCLANPGSVDAEVNVSFIFPDGAAVTLPYTVPAWKRYTVDVNATVGPEKDVAVRVDSSQPIVAERPMYFSYRGGWDDGHITIGATAPPPNGISPRAPPGQASRSGCAWPTPARRTPPWRSPITSRPAAEVRQYVSVPPRAGEPSTLTRSWAGTDAAVKVSSDKPIVAERPMYFDYRSKWNGVISPSGGSPRHQLVLRRGHHPGRVRGMAVPAQSRRRGALVTVKYVFQDATTRTQDLLLAPGQRFSINVNEVVGPDRDVSIWVESQQGIVAERSMYFSYHDAWDGGHNSIGSLP